MSVNFLFDYLLYTIIIIIIIIFWITYIISNIPIILYYTQYIMIHLLINYAGRNTVIIIFSFDVLGKHYTSYV